MKKPVKGGLQQRSKTAALVAAMACLLAPAALRAQVSLATVVDLAQRNSSAVRLAQADVEKTSAVLSESKDVYIPSLLFSTGIPAFPEVGFTGQPPSIWSVTVQSLVFSIPQKHYTSAARDGLAAAQLKLKDAREQAALDASSAYIELDTVQRELVAADEQMQHANRLVEIEQQRTEAGVDPLSELLQAKLTAAQLRLAHVHLEKRASTLAKTMAVLTGLPVGSIQPDHASIPEIPQIRGDVKHTHLPGLLAAQQAAYAKQQMAKGDQEVNLIPQLSFFAQYNRNTTILNDVNRFFRQDLPANNFASGFNINIPLDLGHWAKAKESRADALRATVEAEEADRQNDAAVAELTATLRELDAQAEVASLQQQIAGNQLKTVKTQLENSAPQGATQITPKTEEMAQVDERQRYNNALEADLNLAKTRLGLLRALGHISDWLNELRAAPAPAK